MSLKSLNEIVSRQGLVEIDKWIAKYPPENKSSAVMAALKVVQDECGYLKKQDMDSVANYLDMEYISVYEVATFYSMYDLQPVGKIKVCVCTNISCMLCGSESIVSYLENKLKIKLGQTTDDNLYTLKEVECLGACGGAPMMQIGNHFYENLTPKKIDEILESLQMEPNTEIKTAESAAS